VEAVAAGDTVVVEEVAAGDTVVVVTAVDMEVVEADAEAAVMEADVTHRILLLANLHTATSLRTVTVSRVAAGQ